ncbi:IS3 family transposase [Limnoglobus roseus]|uniref:IS3 family transposase n=1 Tax=Limnoglobus roseus TaxID=2598579 RepID=A0A5C1AMV3_9BACT|nr:transposase [Limnoglobus roseus]QEL20749.1 IS3 family transposase [Limnoglobus roseus]
MFKVDPTADAVGPHLLGEEKLPPAFMVKRLRKHDGGTASARPAGGRSLNLPTSCGHGVKGTLPAEEPLISEARRTFTREFKVAAVQLVTGKGKSVSEAARTPDNRPFLPKADPKPGK